MSKDDRRDQFSNDIERESEDSGVELRAIITFNDPPEILADGTDNWSGARSRIKWYL